MPRSTCVHSDHQSTVALALERNGYLTQGELAITLEIALSTVSRFFRGIRISIANFEQICEALALEPREISREIMRPLTQAPDSSRTTSPSISDPTTTSPQFFGLFGNSRGRP